MIAAISLLPLHAFMGYISTVPVLVPDLNYFFMRDKVNAVHQFEFVTEPSDAKVAEYAKKIPDTCRIFIAAGSIPESSSHVSF